MSSARMAQMDSANGSAGTNQARLMHDRSSRWRRAQARPPTQIVRELRRQAVAHSRHQCLRRQSAHHPHRRRASARSSYQYTLQGLDLDQLQDVFRPAGGRYAAGPAAPLSASTAIWMRRCRRCRSHIDRDRAAALGVPPQQIETALGDAFGGQQISQINASSNQYEVMLELLPQLPEQRLRPATGFMSPPTAARWCR